jgi:hypothetical protein
MISCDRIHVADSVFQADGEQLVRIDGSSENAPVYSISMIGMFMIGMLPLSVEGRWLSVISRLVLDVSHPLGKPSWSLAQ